MNRSQLRIGSAILLAWLVYSAGVSSASAEGRHGESSNVGTRTSATEGADDGSGDSPSERDDDESPPRPEAARQFELMAVGFFESSGSLSPGARAAFEYRPWSAFGLTTGATFVSTSRDTNLGTIGGRRLGADFAGTMRHGAGPVLSSAAVGARAGWAWFSSSDFDPDPPSAFYSQLFFRGRGEWLFAARWYMIFQMELAVAVVSVEAVAEATPVENIAGLEADLGLGIGYRF